MKGSKVDYTRLALISLSIILLSLGIYFSLHNVKESFVNASDPYAVPYNVVVGQESDRLPSLNFTTCSKSCCTPDKMSSMSCLNGCVCKSEKNSELLTTRGGNRMYDNEY